MEFPGFLGVLLYRLRVWLQQAPVAAVGPLLGIVAADVAIDIRRGNLSSAAIELIIAPAIALVFGFLSQQDRPGLSGLLMLALGAISALGASMLLALAFVHGSAVLTIIGLRHFTVALYAWATIAAEPPPQRRLVLAPATHGF